MTLYQKAKQLYENEEYLDALEHIEFAIKEARFYNEYHYHLYCRILRKLERSKDYLDIIYDLINNKIFEEAMFVDDISWCIYDVYVKEYDESMNYDIIKESKFILERCSQPEEKNTFENPLVFTIFKIVKVIKNRSTVNYKLIAELLEKLDCKKLSTTDTFKFIDDKNKERELASKREQYYQDLSKAYEKLRKYDECYKLCSIALSNDINWHYRNDLWLYARQCYCKCMLSNGDNNDIDDYVKIAEKNRFWYMYHKLANVYFSHGDIDNALKYACKGFDITNDVEKKVNLMYDLGLLFEAKKKYNEAKLFFQCCFYYRNMNGWAVSSDLEYKVKYYEIDDNIKPNLKKLKNITISILSESFNIGEIKMIDKQKGFGFIKTNNNQDIHFRTRNIRNKQRFIPVGCFVEFDIENTEKGITAVNIKVI